MPIHSMAAGPSEAYYLVTRRAPASDVMSCSCLHCAGVAKGRGTAPLHVALKRIAALEKLTLSTMGFRFFYIFFLRTMTFQTHDSARFRGTSQVRKIEDTT